MLDEEGSLPTRRRRAALITRLADRTLAPLHVKPDFLIIGAARAGTTTLKEHLRSHPDILCMRRGEPHYFSSSHGRSWGWYRRLFPTRLERVRARRRTGGPALSGEGSPYDLAHPLAPRRVRDALPDARLIVLLRDPAARALSHWNMRRQRGTETRSFEAVVDQELARLTAGLDEEAATSLPIEMDPEPEEDDDQRPAGPRRGARRAWVDRYAAYVARGIYEGQLRRWHALFPRSQLLVIRSETLFTDPVVALEKVWRHLGLDAVPTPDALARNQRQYREPVPEHVMERLRTFYRPHNQALYEYLAEDLGWP